MASLEQSYTLSQDPAAISSDLYDSLFLLSLLQHGSGSDARDAQSLSTSIDTRSMWHHFLDDLCFLCDSEHAGQSVVSIGVEQGTDGVTFWITTTDIHQESARRHLEEILHLLTDFSLEGSDTQSFVAEITLRSVQRSWDRISAYVDRLDRLIAEKSLAQDDDTQSSGEFLPIRCRIVNSN
ncbi:hypothetical protein WHR41_09404 [Cladosporium halotolerans]|uniref:Uncharacterized protein n=1 Tax=Cladosporium halotolerans TaxID=1052096 RepID=A0AB34KF02_9PEZI